MTSDFLSRKQLAEAASLFLNKEISVARLGAFVAAAEFLADRLMEKGDLLYRDLADPLETLEEVYAVALDRSLIRLPPEEESLVRKALLTIFDLTGESGT